MRSLILSVVLMTPAFAETPMDGPEFEALVTGKTLTFSIGSAPYGVEYYAPNRQVVWSFRGGECITGEWYEKATDAGPNICFTYENNADPQCWMVFEVDGKIRADYVNTPGTTVLYEAQESEPLICGGAGT